MILISHRGNIDGRVEEFENDPSYIDRAILEGFDVEVDVWIVQNILYLGHDYPQYQVDITWFYERKERIWIHCKNTDSVIYFNRSKEDFNYFWHENDTVTLTSKNHIWAYPGKQPIHDSIAVMPEINNDDISKCIGVCSDKIKEFLHNKLISDSFI
jgi:hypothetical protein